MTARIEHAEADPALVDEVGRRDERNQPRTEVGDRDADQDHEPQQGARRDPGEQQLLALRHPPEQHQRRPAEHHLHEAPELAPDERDQRRKQSHGGHRWQPVCHVARPLRMAPTRPLSASSNRLVGPSASRFTSFLTAVRSLHRVTPTPNDGRLTRRLLHPMRPPLSERPVVRSWLHGLQQHRRATAAARRSRRRPGHFPPRAPRASRVATPGRICEPPPPATFSVSRFLRVSSSSSTSRVVPSSPCLRRADRLCAW